MLINERKIKGKDNTLNNRISADTIIIKIDIIMVTDVSIITEDISQTTTVTDSGNRNRNGNVITDTIKKDTQAVIITKIDGVF